MSILVPGAGGSFSRLISAGTTAYEVLGPFGPAAFLRRLYGSFLLTLDAVTGVAVTFAPVVSDSGIATADAHAAGRALVTRSVQLTNGIPGWVWASAAERYIDFVLPLGVPVRSGAAYVICGMYCSALTGVVYANVGIEVLRYEREAGVGGLAGGVT